MESIVSTTPDSVFRLSGDQWMFNLSTKNLATNWTYWYKIHLNDDTDIDVIFATK
jgi:hypothetical protein